MKHLVTGSKGFLGQHLMAALYDDGVSGIDLPECDVRHPCEADTGSYLDTAVGQGAETVWHLAALNDATQTFYDRPWDVLNTQIRGTLNVIDACVANGVKTLVLFSSSEVFQTPPVIPTPESVPFSIPDPTNPRYSYAMGKQAAEMLAWHSAIPRVIVIRPFNVYGPGQRDGHVIPDLIAAIEKKPKELQLGSPEGTTRTFIYVDDFIEGCLVAETMGRKRDTFNVGGVHEWNIAQLASTIIGLMGEDGPGAAIETVRYGFGARGEVSRRRPDTRKLFNLGWTTRHSMVTGLAKTIAWHREQKK